MKKKWKGLEVAWLIVAVLSVLSAIIFKRISVVDNTPEFFKLASNLSAILGVVYVILAAKQERVAYLFGVANVVLYAIAVYNKGLYISTGYNLLYCLPVLIYGYIYWGKLEDSGNSGVKCFDIKQKALGVVLMSIAVIILALISEKVLGGSNVWLDSIVSVCVCVATFLLARKHIEQWILFIISNFMGIILFFPRSFADMESIDLFVMWVIYFLNSIYGYISWRKSLIEERDWNA